ncbi:ATP-dependent zinc metalloprotease FtsH [Streptomyces sp. SID13031]|uniref:ATP-dependent zinc metalloprotease FtsH n=1 Tax=Streptomyces sp. SID13031 TaxID=2706046 RepID=UPI0013CA46F3|nr:ATP-dependent zinc metalloprotease FtsH [Streptomyces sp. SID13031]NEA30744.1 ATP-dependent zinc metalloprotease FtsH [Streptomyces sp. SID13031]
MAADGDAGGHRAADAELVHNGLIHRTGTAKAGPPPDRPTPPAPPPPPKWRNWLLLAGLLVTVGLFLLPGRNVQQIDYSQLKSDIGAGQVSSVAIGPDGSINGNLTNGTSFTSSYPVGLQDAQFTQLLDDHKVQVTTQPARTSVTSVLLNLLPLAIIVGLFVWTGRAARRQLAGLGGIGRSRGKLFDTERPSTTFADVAGYQGAKREVTEVVDFLKHPDRYRKAGAVGPKGVLMVGPPGTGKTLLARAVAGEAGVPFISVTGSSFVEMFVGVGAARVRDLFADARRRAPSIVFIDEIDAIGQRRGGQFGTNDEREQTLNQLLAELDGFDPATGVVLIGATNRPEILDPALLRPGRFDRQVVIPLPAQRERRAILGVHSQGKSLGPDVDLEVVARATPGFSGADLANLINEAAIFAVRAGREVIEAFDFAEARDRILLGHRDSSNALLPDEKHAVAVHESGHALVAALAEHGDPVAKVTILPAGQALGVTEQLPVDERHLQSEGYLKDSLSIRMGGRVAERIVLGEISTGAANDLASATALATRMVREFGMSSTLGPVGFSSGSPKYLGGEEIGNRPYAEATQRVIDEEVANLLREAEQRATTALTDHRAELDQLTELLQEQETIDGTDVDRILGRHLAGQRAVGAGNGPGESR